MNQGEQTTLDRILSAAMEEFLAKGFKSASLRNIVKTAGVTTGAFYGYYDSKEALFEALAGPHYDFFWTALAGHRRSLPGSRPRSSRTALWIFPASVCMRCFGMPMSI